MDFQKLIDNLSLNEFPIALGGCKTKQTSFDCCEYNITVFDEKKEKDLVTDFEGNFVKVHHGSLKETNPGILTKFSDMKILNDEKWDLRIFLTQIAEKKEKFFMANAKSCIIESAVCLTKSKESLKNSSPFSSSWVKCAAFFLADAIVLSNLQYPSPAHMLDQIRSFEKNKINEKFSLVNECIGIERATPSELERMAKSTMGFSDMVESNGHSKIIQKKYEFMVKNSLIPDCYFYLGYINRNNFIVIKDTIERQPEMIHVLKTAFDLENDITKIEKQSGLLEGVANNLLSIVN